MLHSILYLNLTYLTTQLILIIVDLVFTITGSLWYTMPISTNHIPLFTIEPLYEYISLCYIHDCLLSPFWLKSTCAFISSAFTYYCISTEAILIVSVRFVNEVGESKCYRLLFISSLVDVMTLAESTVLSVIIPWKDTYILLNSLTLTTHTPQFTETTGVWI